MNYLNQNNSERLLATKYLASIISHMRNKTNIDKRTIAIKKIPLNENFLKANGFPDSPDILETSLTEISECIFQTIYGTKHHQVNQDMIPGIILAPDIQKSRFTRDIQDVSKQELFPHIHGIIVLPYELADWQIKILVAEITKSLREIPCVDRAPLDAADHRQIKFSKFIPVTPLWNFVDYSTKTNKKISCSRTGNSFQPLLYPYDLQMRRLKKRKAKNENSSGYDAQINALQANAARTYEHLILQPWDFFDSDMCCDVSDDHKTIAAQQALSGGSLIHNSNRNRLVHLLERDGGAYLNNQVPYSFPKTPTTSVPLGVLDFLDEVARAEVYGLHEPHPSDQLVHTVTNPFSNYGSFTAWAKSYEEYFSRRLLWQMRRYGAERVADYAPKSLAA